jgi:Zn-dependent peptidase ImmA (M78 family)/transcriptional regulator with XRE-family HTH domain
VASERALVKASVLRWARESRGLSVAEAAQLLHVSEERLASWEDEADESAPTVKQLRRLAGVYTRPLGVLYLSSPPEEEELVADFRRLPDAEAAERSPALRLEIRLAHERRQEAIELAAAIAQEPPRLGVQASLQDEPEALAGRLRERLGVSLAQQRAWSADREAFNAWRDALEACGVLVFQTGGTPRYRVEPAEVRGFSIAEHPWPVVVANGREAPVARIFTLLHELAHVALRRPGLCDLHELARPTAEADRVEAFCNRVAGAVLVPSAALEAEHTVQRHGRAPRWRDEELRELARRFWVSQEVALRRLVILGRASRDFYQAWRAERERRPPSEQERGGFLRPHDLVLKRSGHLFPRLVFRAFRERRIPLSDVIELLSVGPQHFEKTERGAFEGGQ